VYWAVYREPMREMYAPPPLRLSAADFRLQNDHSLSEWPGPPSEIVLRLSKDCIGIEGWANSSEAKSLRIYTPVTV